MQADTLNMADTGFATALADSVRSGVAWGAIIAGAAAASAVSLLLFMLGMGIGLSSVTPFAIQTQTLGWSSIGWVALTQLAASGAGGYLAGRLHTRWTAANRADAGFRDMAHGLLAWAVASLMMALLLAGSVRAVLSGAVDIGAAAVSRQNNSNVTEYYADMLLRSSGSPEVATPTLRNEVGKILLANLSSESLSPDDRAYLVRMVMARTGSSEAEASARVNGIYTRFMRATSEAQLQAREAAEQARRAAAYSALWMVAALVLGAITASVCAAWGGRERAE